jgi:hypothetical protein
MSKLYNLYCDESCHLEHRNLTSENRFMVLGGISCADSMKKEIFQRIKSIKSENGLGALSEMKWTKVSRPKLAAYRDLIHYFFDQDELSFRAVVIDKAQLNHSAFGHSHDEFYYKMYWQMLEWFVEPAHRYHIYLDMKDTLGIQKLKKLEDVLCNSKHDYDRKVIKRIQEVRSHEIALMQMVDVLIGTVSYANRYPDGGHSPAKQELVDLIRKRTSVTLTRSTSLGARKFNLFCWEGRV